MCGIRTSWRSNGCYLVSFGISWAGHGAWHPAHRKCLLNKCLLASVLSSFPTPLRPGSPPCCPHSHQGSAPWHGLEWPLHLPEGSPSLMPRTSSLAQPALPSASDATKPPPPLPLGLPEPSSQHSDIPPVLQAQQPHEGLGQSW